MKKENTERQFDEIKRTTHAQNENFNREIKIIKKNRLLGNIF